MQINLTLGQILNLVEGKAVFNSLALDESFEIKNISSFENAKSNDLAIFIDRGDGSVFDSLSLDIIKNSDAGLILSSKELVPGKNYLLVDDSVASFTKIVEFVQSKNLISGIHSDAVVSDKAKIENGVSVGAYSIVEDGVNIGSGSEISGHVFLGYNVKIGKNVKIHPGVRILHDCVVGNNSIIHSGSVIGSDGYGYSVTKTGMEKIPQIGIVRIGKDVELGANVTIDRAAFDETLIDDGVKIDNMVHIAHNVKVGKFTAIIAQTGIAGSVQIGMGCQIGGQVAIKDHIKIGNGAKIVSKSAVMKDMKDGEIVAGIPAISFSKWKRSMVAIARLPELVSLVRKFNNFSQMSLWQRFLTVFLKKR